MLHLKFPNHFPINFTFRKYGILWRRVGYCCGMSHFKPQALLILQFAFTDIYTWRCPQCGRIHGLEFIYHAVPYHSKEMRQYNKMLEDKK